MSQQARHALFAKSGDATVLGFPEPAVVHQQGIGPALDCRLDQGLAGGDSAHHAAHLLPAFHLQTVWAIIAEPRGIEFLVQPGTKFLAPQAYPRHHSRPAKIRIMRRLWLTFAQTVTVCVAILFVVKTLKPEWLAHLPEHSRRRRRSGDRTGSRARRRGKPARLIRRSGKKAVPAVVHIFTSQEVKGARHPFMNDPIFRHFFGDRFGEESQRRSGLGSGVVVSPEGYILTNFHVIDGADEIEVAHNDGRKYKARVVGSDPESDLAVLRIPADHKLPVIAFGNSDSLRVGDVVLAIGNPFGVGQTVTSGIVSAWGAATSASIPSKTSSRPMPRSIRAIRAVRWSTPMAA
jgi:hypothetical protein